MRQGIKATQIWYENVTQAEIKLCTSQKFEQEGNVELMKSLLLLNAVVDFS